MIALHRCFSRIALVYLLLVSMTWVNASNDENKSNDDHSQYQVHQNAYDNAQNEHDNMRLVTGLRTTYLEWLRQLKERADTCSTLDGWNRIQASINVLQELCSQMEDLVDRILVDGGAKELGKDTVDQLRWGISWLQQTARRALNELQN
eukprot:87699_1